jgi:glucose/arabinose dehydrogenase
MKTPNPARAARVEPLEQRTLFALPPGFTDAAVATGLTRPVALDIAPDGRFFVTEQAGAVRVVKNGQLLPTPFVQLSVSSAGERGVDGIVLDPDFATNHYVYVYYTAKHPYAHNRVSRFTADGDVAAAGSEQVIFELDRLGDAPIHNGGAMRFGPDGKLYVTTGENASGAKAQSLNTTLGKILRINPDGSIPADNPFFARTTGNNRAIWAMGLRNPYTMDIERGTGVMYVNDVGEATWEEIDVGAPGANFGWPKEEGVGTNPAFTQPIYAYHHDTGTPNGCSIVGGTFYDPPTPAPGQFPADFAGDYFFADGCGAWIWRLDRETGAASPFADAVGPAFNLTTGADGSLYYVAYNQGELRTIGFMQPAGAVVINSPASQSVAAGQPVTFGVVAAGLESLRYQWLRDGVPIPGARDKTYTIDATTPADNGATFSVVVENELGAATSSAATLTVVVDQPPAATILLPREGATYTAGSVLKYRGVATDAEDGKLPASAYSWRVDFHHDEHFHPFVPDTAGKKSGRARIPADGETSSNVWYRVHLTVTDSAGVSTTTFRDVHPVTSNVTVQTSVPGLTLNLDGQPVAAPFSFTGVVGLHRSVEAPATQVLDGVTYEFKGWGGKKANVLHLRTPKQARTLVARYEPAAG